MSKTKRLGRATIKIAGMEGEVDVSADAHEDFFGATQRVRYRSRNSQRTTIKLVSTLTGDDVHYVVARHKRKRRGGGPVPLTGNMWTHVDTTTSTRTEEGRAVIDAPHGPNGAIEMYCQVSRDHPWSKPCQGHETLSLD